MRKSANSVSNIAALVLAVVLMSCSGPQADNESQLSQATQHEPGVGGGPPRVRLITQEQYLNTVEYLFGPTIKADIKFAPVRREGGLLALGAASAVVVPAVLTQFEHIARTIAAQVVDPVHRDVLVPCTPVSETASGPACARMFLSEVGRLLFRRPLRQDEIQRYVRTAGESADKAKDFYAGLSYSLSGMLISPKFLYLTEVAEVDPAHPGSYRLNAHSRALRLSLLLWNAPPDDQLLTAAENSELDSKEGLSRQVERLLASSRLENGIRAFFADMLVLDAIDNLAKDRVIYPAFTLKVAADTGEQTLRTIVDHLMVRRGDYRDLFTTRRSFINGDLGMIYRLPAERPHEWVPIEFDSANQRAGLLTQLSFLTLYSHPGRSSPTRRGKALREIFLCQKVPEPPPNVDFSGFEDPSGEFKTARQRLAIHRGNPVCAGCHKITDPMGLALENFDGAGQFRSKENGELIDASGKLDEVEFTTPVGLGQALHDHPATTSCLVERLYAYGVGRDMEPADSEWLDYLGQRFAAHGYRVPDLLREIAESSAFYSVIKEIAAPVKTAAVSHQ